MASGYPIFALVRQFRDFGNLPKMATSPPPVTLKGDPVEARHLRRDLANEVGDLGKGGGRFKRLVLLWV